MKASFIALGMMLSSMAAAQPLNHQHHRRNIVHITVTTTLVEVVYLTTTTYINPSDVPSTSCTTTDSAATSSADYVPLVVAAAPSSPYQAPAAPSPPPVRDEPKKEEPKPQPKHQAVKEAPIAQVIPPPQPKPVVQVVQAPAPAPAPAPVNIVVAPPPAPAPAPAPVSVYQASSQPATSPNANYGAIKAVSSSSDVFSGGDGTFYNTGIGACGIENHDTELVCALAAQMFDPQTPSQNPNNNPLCGKMLKAWCPETPGKFVMVKVVDRCNGCTNVNSLDLSPAAFQKLQAFGIGRFSIAWAWA